MSDHKPEWTGAKPTFAGAVAAMWLEYVHGLILLADSARSPRITPDMHTSLCDRIERCLKHLELSSMPIPDMTLEEVIDMGREMYEDETAEQQAERNETIAEREPGKPPENVVAQVEARQAHDAEEYAAYLKEREQQKPEPVEEPVVLDEEWKQKTVAAYNEMMAEQEAEQKNGNGPKEQGKRGVCSTCGGGAASAKHLNECPAYKGPHHQHHWKIETPAGPTSKGVCTGCGEEKEFKSGNEWVRDEPSALPAWSRVKRQEADDPSG